MRTPSNFADVAAVDVRVCINHFMEPLSPERRKMHQQICGLIPRYKPTIECEILLEA
jgi:hypothetical protein